jgi:hypothetical protein
MGYESPSPSMTKERKVSEPISRSARTDTTGSKSVTVTLFLLSSHGVKLFQTPFVRTFGIVVDSAFRISNIDLRRGGSSSMVVVVLEWVEGAALCVERTN